jgi:hypothetical protein
MFQWAAHVHQHDDRCANMTTTAVTERCIAYHTRARATVRDVQAELGELAGGAR